MLNKKIILAGGSGFIGQGLAEEFGRDNEIVILGRQAGGRNNNLGLKKTGNNADLNIRYVKWNAKDVEESWAKELDGADLVINLAGKSVNCRYHKKQKREIIDSRVLSTRAIGEAIRLAKQPPPMWINAASTTIYRNTYGNANDEFTGQISDLKKDNMPTNLIDRLRREKNRILARIRHGKDSDQYRETDIDFSVKVCQLWERAFEEQQVPNTKKITLRTAIVIGNGGVIIPFLNLCKFAAGGKQGNGKQYISWVHMSDVAGMVRWLYNNGKEGIYNCVAPGAVTNAEFMRTLRKSAGHYFGLPTPALFLELGTWMIGSESELILKSRRVYPARALKEGYVFSYPSLDGAMKQVISTLPRKAYHLV
ncbi:MAG TPA: DUF1731 domain-containing protein [Ohtaekwangia sp.]|nr:DUF1731 domain-containing protein [Ohtaekwangia sp.]